MKCICSSLLFGVQMYEKSCNPAIIFGIKKLSLHDKYYRKMKMDLKMFDGIDRPMYVVEESRLRHNLHMINKVAERANVEIILAFKAFALWKTFPIFKEYIRATTASSLYEARLGFEEFGASTHTFSPAYTDYEIDEIAHYSSHLTFNSLSQYDRFHERVRVQNAHTSIGLRINPEYSEVETELYNPCSPGTRFGITSDKLPNTLSRDIEGFHCHCLCESGADVFGRTLAHIEEKFSKWFSQLKWINFGGGHLMTRKNYDFELLVHLLLEFRSRYPHLKVILEPGSAFAWQVGPLIAQVIDVVENRNIRTAILNVSFVCHMPDCLEMPYMPTIRGAKKVEDASVLTGTERLFYRLGGNSCLSGDYMGMWQFDHELRVGENIIFEDMIHYTIVKTCMFNGITHPAIAIVHNDNRVELLRRFSYKDYRERMD